MLDANRTLFELIHRLSGRSGFLDTAAVFFATYFPYLLGLAVLFLIFRFHKEWRLRFAFFAEIALAAILSRGILTEAIRFFWPVPRPFLALDFTPLIEASSAAFPSGHAAIFFALAMVIFYWNRKWGMWFFAFALVNGAARVFAGVHWPLDIFGGLLVGVLGAVIAHALLRSYVSALPDRKLHE